MLTATLLTLALTGQIISGSQGMSALDQARKQTSINAWASLGAYNQWLAQQNAFMINQQQFLWQTQQQRLATLRNRPRKTGLANAPISKPVMSKEAREAQIKRNLELNLKP